MPCVDLTTSSLMTALMRSNVVSIGPLEADDDDGGLKAGVAPSNQETQTDAFSGH